MRAWRATDPPKDIDPRIYEILKRLNEGMSQTTKSVNVITNNITNLGTNPDLTNYFYLPGRAGGQVGFGASLTSDSGSIARLVLQAYNNFAGSVSARSSRFEMSNDVAIRCDSLYIVERDLTFAGVDGFQFLTGSGFGSQFNVFGGAVRLLANSAGGSPQLLIDNSPAGSSAAAVLSIIKGKSGQTGDLTRWEDNTGAILSKITANGTFVGPIASTSAASFVDSLFSLVDDGDNTKVLQFQVSGVATGTTRTLTVPNASGTIALTDLAQTWSALQKFPDNNFQVVGSADASKIVAVEVDGLTTATTRTLTVPDTSGTVLVGGTVVSNILPVVNNTAGPYTLTSDFSGLSGTASGTLTLLSVGISGTPGYTAGSFTLRGLVFAPSLTVPSGVTLTALIGTFVDWNYGSAAGAVTASYAALFRNRRAASSGPIVSDIVGVGSSPANNTNTNGGTPVATMRAFLALRSTIGTAVTYGPGTVTDAVAFDVDSTFAANAVFANWSGLRIPSISGPGTIWGLNITGTMNNQIAGKLALGGAATPAHMLDLAAGTTTVAPIRMAVAANLLTTAVAGCYEYDGTLFYLTHSDAVRTAVPTRRGILDLTAQAAAIGATTLYAVPAAGYYTVHYTLEDTTADVTAGTIQFQVNYTDDVGATNQTGAALAMTAAGRDRGSFQVYVAAAGNITYQTNLVGIVGTARYALRVRLVHMG